MVEVKSTNPENKIEKDIYFSEHLVVANGHFSVPNYPKLQGQEEWDGKTIHSHEWRQEVWEKLGGKTVLVYGAKLTGLDLMLSLRHKMNPKAEKVYIMGDPMMIKSIKNSADWADDINAGHLVPVEGKIAELRHGRIAVFESNG